MFLPPLCAAAFSAKPSPRLSRERQNKPASLLACIRKPLRNRPNGWRDSVCRTHLLFDGSLVLGVFAVVWVNAQTVAPAGGPDQVTEVRVEGLRAIQESKVRSLLETHSRSHLRPTAVRERRAQAGWQGLVSRCAIEPESHPQRRYCDDQSRRTADSGIRQIPGQQKDKVRQTGEGNGAEERQPRSIPMLSKKANAKSKPSTRPRATATCRSPSWKEPR